MDQKVIDEIAKATHTSPAIIAQLIHHLAVVNKRDPDTVIHKLCDEYIHKSHHSSREDTIHSLAERIAMPPEEAKKLLDEMIALVQKPS